MAVGFAQAVSVFRECAYISKLTCQHLKLRRIIECFKLLKGSKHIRCTNANAVVLQQRDIAPRFKHLSNFHAELLAAWNRIDRKFYVSAYVSYRRDQVKVWELADNGKRYKRRWVRVQNCIQIQAQMINRPMERQFGRWLMLSFADSVRTDTDDVFSAECTLVNAGRSNPNVPLRIAD